SLCSSRRRHTRSKRDWSSDVCSSDLGILFFQKFGMGLAGGFIGIALAYLDYQPGVEQTPQALWGICLLMTIIPAILNLLTGLIMRFYLINNEYYEQIKARLQTAEE